MESFDTLTTTGNFVLSLPKLLENDKLPLTVPVPADTSVNNVGLLITEPPESVIVISLVVTVPLRFC